MSPEISNTKKSISNIDNVSVLGAGYMGSAVTFPLSDNNINVNLWGTWLDENIISSAKSGIHPKLKTKLAKNVKLFYWQDLLKAIENSNIFFIGIASEGFVNIFQMLIDNLKKFETRKSNNKNNYLRDHYFFKLTKGLVDYKGTIMRASEAAKLIYQEQFPDKNFYFTTIGGPVRAIDLANRIPSATVYGIDKKVLACVQPIIDRFATDYYRIFISSYPEVVETCSTFKNIYAISAGICDGIYGKTKPGLYHNLVSFLFTQASIEIASICKFLFKEKIQIENIEKIVFNFAGIGDLHVTSVAGRNRKFGELIGQGYKGEEAFKKMFDEGEYGEGYMALKLGLPWLEKKLNEKLSKEKNSNINKNKNYVYNNFIKREFPLLYMLYDVIFKDKDLKESLRQLIKNI